MFLSLFCPLSSPRCLLFLVSFSSPKFVPNSEVVEIRNVWRDNLDAEFSLLRDLVEKHPYIAMDTEFPGVVARPVNSTYAPDYQYQSLKCNVDLLRVIQIGISLADENGNFAKGTPCFQFNFSFSLKEDMFAQDSIELLHDSGISFKDHEERGIDPFRFGELIMSSGLVLTPGVTWICYHGGYDFGYLLKLLTSQHLPAEEKDFFDLLFRYFPTVYDIKYMTSLLDGFFGGLQKCADDLGVKRIGPEHQAGSDSLLTMSTYFELAGKKFLAPDGVTVETQRFRNELFGYGTNQTNVRRKGPGAEDK